MQPETFGEKVARLRKEKQMTQANLAAIMHVTDKAVSKWECDVAYPEITSLPLLAESLGTTADALLSKTEMVKRPFQPRKFLGIFLSALIVLFSAFEILVTRMNHESWTYDCIQLLVLGGVVWSFQKRDWTESGMDFAYKILIIFVGITLCVWMLLDGCWRYNVCDTGCQPCHVRCPATLLARKQNEQAKTRERRHLTRL